MDTSDIRYCMRCLEPLGETTRRDCFKCRRVTCASKDCGTWAVVNRFWTCQICVNADIEAIIDVHEPKDNE